jgi:hypothetical protein
VTQVRLISSLAAAGELLQLLTRLLGQGFQVGTLRRGFRFSMGSGAVRPARDAWGTMKP